MQNKYEAVDSIKEISLEELDQIIGAGKNGVFKTISHEYRMNSFQFYSLVVLNVMSLVILDVATKRGKPLFVFLLKVVLFYCYRIRDNKRAKLELYFS